MAGSIHRSTGGQTYTVVRFVNHPSFSSDRLANDISLIQTARTMVFSNLAKPVAIGSTFIDAGVNAVATGFGQISRNGPNSAGLQWVSLRTISNQECRGKFSAANAARVFDNTLCTFTRRGEG